MSKPAKNTVNQLALGILCVLLITGMVESCAESHKKWNDQDTGTVIGLMIFPGVPLALVAVVLLTKRFIRWRYHIDGRLRALLGGLNGFRSYHKTLPRFRFVDLHYAAATLADTANGWVALDTHHGASLAMILTRRFYQPNDQRMRRAEMTARTVGPGEERYYPQDCFWILPAAAARRQGINPCVIRVRQGPMPHQTTVEIASRHAREGTALVERLVRLSAEKSIYRNHTLDLEFSGEVRDEEGNVEQHENFDLVFKTAPAVGPDDIVMEPEVARALERNVLDFHRRRAALMALGLPGRRGVLLYGPPGTGKTYTCKFLASQLAGTITVLVASGESLLRVRSICNLARLFQPAMIVLEDVDLVYAARESGLGHNASLGKLMDELDGFGRDDHIIFILTTNAIDRVERAVSDRPGRISQCVFLGPPSDPLRRRYLRAQLAHYDAAAVDMDGLTASTEGTTQAFLKELVFRAVQIASLGETVKVDGTNGDTPGKGRLALRDEHFAEALAEMRGTGGRAGETIIGFRTAGF